MYNNNEIDDFKEFYMILTETWVLDRLRVCLRK